MNEAAWERLGEYVAALDDEEALILHRLACRRAGPLYVQRHRSKWEANFKTAMGIRDTRFRAGLTVRENIERCMRPWGSEAA